MFRLTYRVLLLCLAVTATLASALPVAGAELLSETGRTGEAQVGEPGAICKYDQATFKLRSIRVLKPTVYSDYAAGTIAWVGWRVKVVRRTSKTTGPWKVIYTSPWHKDTATNVVAADGFVRADWNAPANPSGYYMVRVVIAFFAPGSKKAVEGKTVFEVTGYRSQYGSHVGDYASGWCVEQD